MGNESLKACREISNKLLNSGFNKSINELSIFIYKNYVENMSEEVEKSDASEESEIIEEKSFGEEEGPVFSEQDKDSEDDGSFFEEEEVEEGGDKISRLKELARNNPILNKKGTVVRRVSTW